MPTKLLESWFEIWAKNYNISDKLSVAIRPHTAGSELLELNVRDRSGTKVGNVIFDTIQDRRDRCILSMRDQNTFKDEFRKKRFMTLIHIFLIHRYKAESVHYVSPTEDNEKQTKGMKKFGVYDEVNVEVGDIIVATVNADCVASLLDPDEVELGKLITKAK